MERQPNSRQNAVTRPGIINIHIGHYYPSKILKLQSMNPVSIFIPDFDLPKDGKDYKHYQLALRPSVGGSASHLWILPEHRLRHLSTLHSRDPVELRLCESEYALPLLTAVISIYLNL
jgi:hypothetical protein